MNVHETTLAVRKAKVLEFPGAPQPGSRLLVPKAHGSWALWLLPLFSGSVVGYVSTRDAALAPALWFLLLATAAFLIHQPLESLLGVSVLKVRSLREQRIAVFWVMGMTVVAAFGVFEVVRAQRTLVFAFGVVAGTCFTLSAVFSRRRVLRVPRQIVGALGLSATAAGSYYVITGRIDRTALLLWLAAWLFALGQIEYVQLRLHTANINSRRGRANAAWKVFSLHFILLTVAIVAAAAGLVPALCSVVFFPATIRLLAWVAGPRHPLRLHVLGFTELFQSVVFNALLTAAFLLH